MLYLIYGKQNTGKSEFFEKIIENKYSKIVYFATLWESKDTYEKIRKHQKRRNDKWIFGKSIGDSYEDQIYIMKLLEGLDKNSGFMIDGLTNWCMYCAKKNNNYIEETKKLVDIIINIINSNEHINWYLLDNVKSDYNKVPILLDTWDIIYNNLLDKIKSLEIIEWSN